MYVRVGWEVRAPATATAPTPGPVPVKQSKCTHARTQRNPRLHCTALRYDAGTPVVRRFLGICLFYSVLLYSCWTPAVRRSVIRCVGEKEGRK